MSHIRRYRRKPVFGSGPNGSRKINYHRLDYVRFQCSEGILRIQYDNAVARGHDHQPAFIGCNPDAPTFVFECTVDAPARNIQQLFIYRGVYHFLTLKVISYHAMCIGGKQEGISIPENSIDITFPHAGKV